MTRILCLVACLLAFRPSDARADHTGRVIAGGFFTAVEIGVATPFVLVDVSSAARGKWISRGWAWAQIVGGGSAFLLCGLGFRGLALEAANPEAEGDDPSTYRNRSLASFAIGAFFITHGVLSLRLRKDDVQPRMSWTVSPLDGGGLATVGGRF
jgi:hypothetical protein